MYSGFKKNEPRENASEASIIEKMQPAFNLAAPAIATSPLIFASPHSGRIYPLEWVKSCALKLSALRQSEDAFVDQLFKSAPDHGAPLLSAQFPRSFVDANRAANELPPPWLDAGTPPTARAKGGLGIIPMAIGENMAIYNTPPTKAAGLARLSLYDDYHGALQAEIDAAKARFGCAFLIDCHSMPGFGAMGARRSDFILGDRYAKSCAPHLIDNVSAYLKRAGYSVTRNYPYAGGYVTEHYGRPDDDVHVLQIEINRDLYLSQPSLRKKAGFAKLQSHMDGLIRALTAQYASERKLAAE